MADQTNDDGPLLITFEVDGDGTAVSQGQPEDVVRQMIVEPLLAALDPTPGQASPRAVVAPAPAPDGIAPTITLQIQIGAARRELACTQEDVMGLVTMAYLAGGFPMVLSARYAIESAIKRLSQNAESGATGVRELENLANSAKGAASTAQQDLPDARADLATARTTLSRSLAALPLFHDYFRRAWNGIAVFEEQALQIYDSAVASSFKQIASANYDLASKEWDRYQPSPKEAGAVLVFDAAQPDDVAVLELTDSVITLLQAEPEAKDAGKPSTKASTTGGTAANAGAFLGKVQDTSGKPQATTPDKQVDSGNKAQSPADDRLKAALEIMWRIAQNLKMEADDIRTDAAVAASPNAKDTPERRQQRNEEDKSHLVEWSKRRTNIGDKYPVLLLVYSQWRSLQEAQAARTTIESQIVQALLAVRDEAKRIATQTTTIWTGDALRVVPLVTNGSAFYSISNSDLLRPVTGPPTPQVLSQLLNGDYKDAAVKYGLTIPASEIVPLMLQQDENFRYNTGWLHTPVSLHLNDRSNTTDPWLLPYFTPGTVHHAAVARVLDNLADLRRKEETWRRRGTFLMWGVAGLLAPFTEGASLYAAGLVQAAGALGEIFTSVQEYNQDASLAKLALSAMEETLWRRPSFVNLARLIVADVTNVALGVIDPADLPLVLGLLLTGISMIHPDERQQGDGQK
jgi:hypothetical protein